MRYPDVSVTCRPIDDRDDAVLKLASLGIKIGLAAIYEATALDPGRTQREAAAG